VYFLEEIGVKGKKGHGKIDLNCGESNESVTGRGAMRPLPLCGPVS